MLSFMNSGRIRSGKIIIRNLTALAVTLTLCQAPAGAQSTPRRQGIHYPFAGGTNPDGSLRPSSPLTRLFTEEYYTEYSLLDPSTGEYRMTRRTEESPIGSSLFDWITSEGEL